MAILYFLTQKKSAMAIYSVGSPLTEVSSEYDPALKVPSYLCIVLECRFNCNGTVCSSSKITDNKIAITPKLFSKILQIKL